jgi:phospholipid/cholesterol/gamma-HCH transport system substrate-binding protein
MKGRKTETAVGIFILIGILCVAYLAIRLGRMQWFGGGTYTLDAYFTSVSGLKAGAPVEIAGVEIGQVENISLDQKTYMADVRLQIRNGLKISDDAIAAVKTSGLIGDKYIQLTQGGSPNMLKSGGTIMDTVSALDIEELISKFVFGKT